MRNVKKLVLSCLALALLLVAGATTHVYAQVDGSSLGGNKATDYQPVTQNPQNGAASGVQTNNTNLQPVAGQPAVSQQTLPAVSNLQVQGVKGGTNPNSTKTTITPDNVKHLQLWPFAIIGIITLVGVVYVVMQPEPGKKPKKTVATAEPAAAKPTEATSAPVSKKSKKPKKAKAKTKSRPKKKSKKH